MTNPLSLLADLIPATARKYVYAVSAAALFIYSLWEVSGGDVKAFAIALGSALVATLAAANTPASQSEVTEATVELVEEKPEIVADALDANDVERDQYLDGHGGQPPLY